MVKQKRFINTAESVLERERERERDKRKTPLLEK